MPLLSRNFIICLYFDFNMIVSKRSKKIYFYYLNADNYQIVQFFLK